VESKKSSARFLVNFQRFSTMQGTVETEQRYSTNHTCRQRVHYWAV